nr:hypothetical protein B0A51_00368 [Rachicladosporium sp. CCFEE 5018]
MVVAGQKRKRGGSDNILPTPQPRHPYLTGNFAPIEKTIPLTPCTYTGTIPEELADGEYVRNGSNPVSNSDLGRDAHWFDGDGMLAGVLFRKDETTGSIRPEFVNQYILTDVYLSSIGSKRLKVPILPSIATLVNPLSSFFWVTLRILRTILLVILSHLPGSKQKIKKISVANTNIVYHDGRALALCESGPPLRIQLPGLETVGWYDGATAEGEPVDAQSTEKEHVLGEGSGLISFMREWTTAHPKLDPKSKEMLMFHASFAPPYVQYSIVPQSKTMDQAGAPLQKVLNAAVPGVRGARMMHDFGVSSSHTIIMDLPLSLDPLLQLQGKPPVSYDSSKPSRFGVFPRREPEKATWFETDACCIFHTANSWDDVDTSGKTSAVNMLACRLTSATMIFATGNIAPPAPPKKTSTDALPKKRMSFFSKYNLDTEASVYQRHGRVESTEEEKESLLHVTSTEISSLVDNDEDEEDRFDEDQCRLYYYQFDLSTSHITHQWALASIPFEFPSVHPDLEMSEAKYVYGCSTSTTSFGSALGKATKIDILVKVDVTTLIARGRANPPRSVSGVVDPRPMADVITSNDPADPIRVFQMPDGWYAQEPRFVPAAAKRSEDDGFLLFYAFDEAQLTLTGDTPLDEGEARARSELWVVDARDMRTVIAQVRLPQRVPYGLHGGWFTGEQVRGQREVEKVRSVVKVLEENEGGVWMGIRDSIEKFLA